MAFIGMYQTMTKKAAITVQVGTGLSHSRSLPGARYHWLPEPTKDIPGITSGMGDPLLGSADPRLLLQKKDFPSHSFYVVVVVKTEDEACGGALPYYPLSKDASPGLRWGCHHGLCVGTSWGQGRELSPVPAFFR